MARAVYSTLLWAGEVAAGSSEELYTVPAGFRVVVRDIQATSSDDVALAVVGLTIAQFYAGGIVARFGGPFVELGRSYSWEGRVVCNAGEILTSSTLYVGWNMTMSGYLLTVD
jgi:hypothetical protein